MRVLSLLLPGILVPIAASHAGVTHKKQHHHPFYLGVSWDNNDSASAKALFYETGCNFVRLGGAGFPGPQVEHRNTLEEFRKHGIYAMLQMGSHWPDWSYDNDADDYFVDDRGESGALDSNHAISYSGSEWPQFSYAGPEFRAHLGKDFTDYLSKIGSDPNVVALQFHNEPGYHWVDGRVFDYNPKAIAAFRLWLPSQYASVAALNASWGTSYATFDDVEPVKQRPPISNISAWMDWRRFNIDLIAKFLSWEADLGHKVCPNVPSTTNMAGPMDNWFALRLGDNYRYTEPFDRAAVDIYASQWTNRFYIGYAMDTTRGAAGERPITVAECDPYDPKQCPGLSDVDLADRLRSDIWRYIGHGASAVAMWTLASADGSRLTSGEFNTRIGAVREIAHLSKMLDLGDFTSTRPSVALVVDQDAFIYYGGIDQNRDGGIRCESSLKGLYAGLVQAGYSVDIISADQVRSGIAPQYRALVLATPALTDNRMVASLASFMTKGGVVVAEAPFAQFDRWGKPLPSTKNTAQALFGIKTSQPYVDGADAAISSLGFQGKGRMALKLDGATALAAFDDGSPAVTLKTRGHGKAILIASDAGVDNTEGSQPGLSRFFLDTLEKNGIVPHVKAQASGYLDAEELHDGQGNYLYVATNTCDQLAAPKKRTDVDLSVTGLNPAAGSQLFVIEPSHTDGLHTIAGPRLITLPRPTAGITHFRLPSIESATVFLVAADHDPLLAVEAPSTCSPGSAAKIRVTCYNPSPSPIVGRVTLNLPEGWRQDTLGPVSIPPRGHVEIIIPITTAATAGRSVVTAKLEEAADAASIDSVPVDIMVGN